MTSPARLYSVVYTLMAEDSGGHAAFEEGLKKYEEEVEQELYNKSTARMAPDRKVPKKAEEGMKGILAFAPPAPRKADA